MPSHGRGVQFLPSKRRIHSTLMEFRPYYPLDNRQNKTYSALSSCPQEIASNFLEFTIFNYANCVPGKFTTYLVSMVHVLFTLGNNEVHRHFPIHFDLSKACLPPYNQIPHSEMKVARKRDKGKEFRSC